MATPEMGRYLRQIVDNSFEEGQFESAVEMLDQLRAPVHRPSIIHILHLVFIALHPVRESQLNDEDRYDPATLLSQSPRKMIKQTKASLVLSAAAVLAARRLLLAFLSTNGAHAMAAALPFYPETKNEPPMEFEFGESPIFEQSAAIKTSTRSVWEILKSGYTSRATQHFTLGSPKGKRRDSARVRFAAEPSFSDVHQDIQVVGDDSWFVLELLVTLFEKDSEETEVQGLPKHSPLLLKQLPPPPIGSSTRWDASEPAKVVFYTFQQPDLRLQKVGLRLLLLLIDLTQCSYLNLPALASTVLAQMTSSSSSSSPSPRTSKNHSPSPAPSFASAFDTLFVHLPSTPAALSFKLALCKKIIEDASAVASADAGDDAGAPSGSTTGARGGAGATGPSAMKRPRAQPRPVARQRTMSESTEGMADPSAAASLPAGPAIAKSASGSSTAPPPISASSTLSSIPSTLPRTFVARLPPWADVVRLARMSVDPATGSNASEHLQKGAQPLRTQPSRPWATPAVLARVKFELLLAYAFVQAMRGEASSTTTTTVPNDSDPPDAAFLRACADGSYATLLEEAFAPQGSNEDEERLGWVLVLRAVVGLSVEVE